MFWEIAKHRIQFCLLVMVFSLGTAVGAEDADRKKADDCEKYLSACRQLPASNSEKAKFKSAIDYLRSYYIVKKEDVKLTALNHRIEEITQVKERNKALFDLLMDLENISCRLSGNKPDEKTGNHIRDVIYRLNEFRWGERDLARALSYVAVGRAYYLLGDYRQALQSSMVDPELFLALDKKFAEQNNREASPLAALLFLSGNCNQSLAEETGNRQDKIKFFGTAATCYYRFVANYPASPSANDAIVKYGRCRADLKETSGEEIVSIDKLKSTVSGSDKLPGSITMLIQSGNYSQAIETLDKECKSRQRQASYPVYALCLAECYAQEGRGKPCMALLNELLEKNSTDAGLADGMLRCAGILRDRKLDAAALNLYQLFLTRYPNHPGAGNAVCAVAEYQLKKLRELYADNKSTGKDLKTCATEAVRLFNLAGEKFKSPRQQYFLVLGRAEANFLSDDFDAAANDYRRALQTPELDKTETAGTALNLARALYYHAVSVKPADQAELTRAEKVIAEYHLLDNDGVKITSEATADAFRLAAMIKDQSGKKEEAGQLLMNLLNNYTYAGQEQKVKDMVMATAIFHETDNTAQATELLQRLAAFQSGDINEIRFKVGKDLFERGKHLEAVKIFDTLLKEGKTLSSDKLIWLLEKLSNLDEFDAENAWRIAFKAGRLLEGRDDVNADDWSLIRLKTASAAIKLKDYPTALAVIEMARGDKNTMVELPARFLKAEALSDMANYAKANAELAEIALIAGRMEQYGLFLRAKYMICKNLIACNEKPSALMLIDNLLLPLKKSEEGMTKTTALPEIYQDILLMAAGAAADAPRRRQYAALYWKLFPNGKFANKAILKNDQ